LFADFFFGSRDRSASQECSEKRGGEAHCHGVGQEVGTQGSAIYRDRFSSPGMDGGDGLLRTAVGNRIGCARVRRPQRRFEALQVDGRSQ